MPFFDARRGNIFAVGYQKTDEGFEKVIAEQHISWDDFLKVLPKHAAGVTFCRAITVNYKRSNRRKKERVRRSGLKGLTRFLTQHRLSN